MPTVFYPEFDLVQGWSNVDHFAPEIIAHAKRELPREGFDTEAEAISGGEKALAIAESEYTGSTPRIRVSAKQVALSVRIPAALGPLTR